MTKPAPEEVAPLLGARVLAVDDDLDTLEALRELLAPEFELLVTADPLAAPELARGGGVRAVLCDLRMPGLDGLTLLRLLRADPATAHLPVLLFSGARNPAERLQALEAGAFDYLTKPADPELLLARLRQAVRQGPSRREAW